MSEKSLSPKNKAILINVCIVATLVWSYYRGYPLLAIAITAVVLLPLANVLMYLKQRKRG